MPTDMARALPKALSSAIYIKRIPGRFRFLLLLLWCSFQARLNLVNPLRSAADEVVSKHGGSERKLLRLANLSNLAADYASARV